MNANIYDIFKSRFAARLDCEVLHLPDGESWTYDQLDRYSARLAHVLLALGCQPGDRVAVQVEKSPAVLALYLACLRAGCVYLPLNTAYKRDELSYFIHDAEPCLVVCRPEDESVVSGLVPSSSVVRTLGENGSGSLLDSLTGQADSFDTVPRARTDLAAILYTSGTTGRSKGAMLTHHNLASNAQTLVKLWGFSSDDVLLHALPIYHIHGLFVACHCVLMAGAAMQFLPRFELKTALPALGDSTVMMGVPTFYTRLLSEPSFDATICGNIRLFVSGSAPLLAETFSEFEQRTGQRILERYGMTETGMNTSNPLHGERLGGTVGLPLPGTTVKVISDAGATLAEGEIGNLLVKGDNVFAGYWRMPEKTQEEFTADGFFKTGDMAQILPNGYVQLVGRAKDLIITGGLNVYAKEIEELIDAMPGVLESAVIGLPDTDLGEAVTAIVVAKPAAMLDPAAMIADMKARLAGFKVPKSIHVVNELPRNAMGKVQKNVLRAGYTKHLA